MLKGRKRRKKRRQRKVELEEKDKAEKLSKEFMNGCMTPIIRQEEWVDDGLLMTTINCSAESGG
jgi:hypothetical protein